MVDIVAQHSMRSTLPIHFIRFNPDAWCVDGKRQTVLMRERHNRLLGELYWRNTDFAVTYLYYDMIDGQPAVFKDPEFPTDLKACCRWNLP